MVMEKVGAGQEKTGSGTKGENETGAGKFWKKRAVTERMIAALKGGHRWHRAVVCPGTTTGWHSAPAFSPIPVGRTDRHTHKRTVTLRFEFLTVNCGDLLSIITNIYSRYDSVHSYEDNILTVA